MKIEIKNKFTGKVIFKHENKNNTIKDTLMEAIKKGVDLRGADLSSAKLYYANLHGTDLRGANLRGTDLSYADLSNTNLHGTDLRGANLRGTDLSNTNLHGTDLRGADLRGANLRGTNLYDAGKIEDWMSFDNVGSRKARTLFFKTDKGVFVQCGCFFGNLKEFVAKVKETHNGNKYENDYLALVEFIKVRFNKNETKEYFSKNTGYNLFKKFIYQIKKNIFLRKV